MPIIVTGALSSPSIAGLRVEDGILVDQFGRTSDPAISAAGDVTRHYNPLLDRHIRLESWQNAQNQAIAVARNVAGAEQPYAEIPWCWSDQFDVNLQILGQPESWDAVYWRQEPAARQFTVFYTKGSKIVGVNAVNNARHIAIARRLMLRDIDVSGVALDDPGLDLARLLQDQSGTAKLRASK